MAENNKRNQGPRFNNEDERQGMDEQFREERKAPADEFTKTSDEMSTGDSIRTNGDVSGSTFGMESNTAKFSNTGQKNQTRKGEEDSNIEEVNRADRQSGSGGTMYSDYLNKEQNDFISGTGQFAGKDIHASGNSGDDTKPFDAMQGNRKPGSGRSGNKS